jgi:hypothetical protein
MEWEIAMRADESKLKRQIDRDKLREVVSAYPPGSRCAIGEWYDRMKQLGLEHSDRQRLSELRKEGWQIRFDRLEKAYVFGGYMEPGQIPLFELTEATR